MINYIKYRRKLAELEERQIKSNSRSKIALKNAKLSNEPREEILSLESIFRFDNSEYESEINTLTSTYYLKKAYDNSIPIPDDSWEAIDDFDRKALTVDGVNNVRTDLRKIKKENAEIYLPYFTLLVGLIGALTGLFAVLSK